LKREIPAIVWPLAALAALCVFNLAANPGFFHVTVMNGHLFGSLVDILNRAAPVLLLSCGMTLVIATGGIDLSVGAVMAVCGAVAACLIARPAGSPLAVFDIHGSALLACGAAVGVGMVLGLFNGLLVAKANVQPIVATLILMVAGRGIAQLLTSGQIVIFDHPQFNSIGAGFSLGLPNPIWIASISFLLAFVLVRATPFGVLVSACGDNPVAARYCGIDIVRIRTIVYVLSGLLAACAGIIATSDIKAADANNVGQYLELDAILAVAIGGGSLTGGRFSLFGSFVGAVLMQSLTTTLLARGTPPEVTLILKAVVVICVCILQSGALSVRLQKRDRQAAG